MSDQPKNEGFVVNTARSMGAAAGRLVLLTGDVGHNNAIALIKKDHDTVKELFDRFEKTDDRDARRQIVEQALLELKLHTVLEEEIFYPAVRQQVGEMQMAEADEEHHVAKILIAELETMDSSDVHYEAKFTVLAESVRHHIREEEHEVLPRAKNLDIDFNALGQAMWGRRQTLLAEGFPQTAPEPGPMKVKRVRRKAVGKPKKEQAKT